MSQSDSPFKRASTSKRARQSENRAAQLEGGRRVSMSGAGREKGDIKAGLFLIEDKYTDNESFSITTKLLKKIAIEAMSEHRLWQLRITLPGYKLRVLKEEDYLYLQAQVSGGQYG